MLILSQVKVRIDPQGQRCQKQGKKRPPPFLEFKNVGGRFHLSPSNMQYALEILAEKNTIFNQYLLLSVNLWYLSPPYQILKFKIKSYLDFKYSAVTDKQLNFVIFYIFSILSFTTYLQMISSLFRFKTLELLMHDIAIWTYIHIIVIEQLRYFKESQLGCNKWDVNNSFFKTQLAEMHPNILERVLLVFPIFSLPTTQSPLILKKKI